MKQNILLLPLVLITLAVVVILGVIVNFQFQESVSIPTQSPPTESKPTSSPAATAQSNQQKPSSPTRQVTLNNGLSVTIFCIDKIYENPCGDIGGVIVKNSSGAEVVRQNSNKEGKFRVSLTPGDYQVIPLQGTPKYPIINTEPRPVKVTHDQFSEVKISYWDGRR